MKLYNQILALRNLNNDDRILPIHDARPTHLHSINVHTHHFTQNRRHRKASEFDSILGES